MKNESMKSQLGATNEEMCSLLDVSPGQWAMYSSGKRKLPQHAMEKLAILLTQIHPVHALSKNTFQITHIDARQHRMLQCMWEENEDKRHVIAKKLVIAQRKHEAAVRRSQLAGAISNDTVRRPPNKAENDIIKRAGQVMETDDVLCLVRLEIRQELLELEKMLIEAKMRKCRPTDSAD